LIVGAFDAFASYKAPSDPTVQMRYLGTVASPRQTGELHSTGANLCPGENHW